MQPISPSRYCLHAPSGNSYNDEERVVAAGYDNGDVKIFDLRTNRCLRQRSNVIRVLTVVDVRAYMF